LSYADFFHDKQGAESYHDNNSRVSTFFSLFESSQTEEHLT